MICEYNWTIEWYSVLSKACLDCPYNKTNCMRKDCVSANGVSRSIITINRQLPGPMIYVCENDIIKVNLYNSMHGSGCMDLALPLTNLSRCSKLHWQKKINEK